ncbi:MAG: hypothetical protein RLZZ350_1950 [Verrucomicrobiota bacterium]|jgi:hypothetical protein
MNNSSHWMIARVTNVVYDAANVDTTLGTWGCSSPQRSAAKTVSIGV